MTILVAYASKHGATHEIAENIAGVLMGAGLAAEARPVTDDIDLTTYDAAVIGSAAYRGRWLKEAVTFVTKNQQLLAVKPVWLFSSGPLGHDPATGAIADTRADSVPHEVPRLQDMVAAREHAVFSGALSPKRLSVPERAIRRLPAGRSILPEGDFREWDEIEVWARTVASQLPRPAPSHGSGRTHDARGN